MEFIEILKGRNEALYWFGIVNLITAIVLIYVSFHKPIEFGGTNAYFKPIKFALSTFILSWSMAWYTGYLKPGLDISIFNWTIILTLAFEVFYITLQASKGEPSHYNNSTPLHSTLFTLMALAASIATLAVGYIGLKFCITDFPELPNYYVYAIRLGILLFVIFSFEGFVMGSKMTHTIGGADGSIGIAFFNWSRIFGDLRIAHFVGMHALQVIPLVSWYLLKDTKLTIALAILYACLAVFVLVQALQGKPLFKLLA